MRLSGDYGFEDPEFTLPQPLCDPSLCPMSSSNLDGVDASRAAEPALSVKGGYAYALERRLGTILAVDGGIGSDYESQRRRPRRASSPHMCSVGVL